MVHYESTSASGNAKAVPQLTSGSDGASTQAWNQAIYDHLNALIPVTKGVPASGEGETLVAAVDAKLPVDVIFKAEGDAEKDKPTVNLVIKVLTSAVPATVYARFIREDADRPADKRFCTEVKVGALKVQNINPWRLFHHCMAIGGDLKTVGQSLDDVEAEVLTHEFDSAGTCVEQVNKEIDWFIDWRDRVQLCGGDLVTTRRLISYLRSSIHDNLPEVYEVGMIQITDYVKLTDAMRLRAGALDKPSAGKRAAKAFAVARGHAAPGTKEDCKNYLRGRMCAAGSISQCPFNHPEGGGNGGGGGGGYKGNKGNGGGGYRHDPNRGRPRKFEGNVCWECGDPGHKAGRCPQVPIEHRPTAAVCTSREEYVDAMSTKVRAPVGAFAVRARTFDTQPAASAGARDTGPHGSSQPEICLQDTVTGMWLPFNARG